MTNPERRGVPQCTLHDYEQGCAGRRLIHQSVRYWASRKPDAIAIISYDRDREVDWRTLECVSNLLAADLIHKGFRKGDFLAASLPMSIEHIFLEYACFKIGVIHAPLDLRLRIPEVLRCIDILKPKAFAYWLPELGTAVKKQCPEIEHCWSQADIAERIARGPEEISSAMPRALADASAAVTENDGAQVIFTTGSTGSPKAALLSHRNITAQNMCLGQGFGFQGERILLNLPASHVGGQSEVLLSALFCGGTVVALEAFEPAKSLHAIEKYQVSLIGQIPAMFQFEWRLSDFSKYDLSSLRKAIYGGQAVSVPFLERMAKMAPRIGTGLGLTETAGFCTYSPLTSSIEEIAAGIGVDMPAYPMTIRENMTPDGMAGKELASGKTGNICFQGPQTFLGYIGDPEATAKTISRDGVLYTGDMGSVDERGLHFTGRAKWIIKPAGYQVFPGDIENHFCALQEKVAACGAVGVEHRLISEAVVLFVEKRAGAEITVAELKRHARNLASYMRPLHYVIVDPGQLPLNRAVKTDYVKLSEMARAEVDRMRAKGRWDS